MRRFVWDVKLSFQHVNQLSSARFAVSELKFKDFQDDDLFQTLKLQKKNGLFSTEHAV